MSAAYRTGAVSKTPSALAEFDKSTHTSTARKGEGFTEEGVLRMDGGVGVVLAKRDECFKIWRYTGLVSLGSGRKFCVMEMQWSGLGSGGGRSL